MIAAIFANMLLQPVFANIFLQLFLRCLKSKSNPNHGCLLDETRAPAQLLFIIKPFKMHFVHALSSRIGAKNKTYQRDSQVEFFRKVLPKETFILILTFDTVKN